MKKLKKLSKFFGETFRNLGVGVMVGSLILSISSSIPRNTLMYLFFLGVAFVVIGSILYLYGE
ncbi:hypothetical protein [Hydrogenivirga sp. 128-5-R1-1]|uniref:hypothetical protein n=1 Tax=Hydrogenivirga sp. 128-5-R1-1 TaxID=392423 RepID=UPI0012FC5757|nr:hypothetical protein [Hydrogenivirga sp. 128-5-R1-1]